MFKSPRPRKFQTAPAASRFSTASGTSPDLQVAKDSGYNRFEWSPDSKRIAFVRWTSGTIGIVNVETGEVEMIPSLQLNGIDALCWSADGTQLAVNNAMQLKIVRLRDSIITHDIDATVSYGRSTRFGRCTTFSLDGSRLLIHSPFYRDRVLAYSLNLATRALDPLILSPFVDKLASPSFGSTRFHTYGSRIFFSIQIMRYFDGRKTEKRIIGDKDYAHITYPSTCFVFDLGNGDNVVSERHLDFPPGVDTFFDSSKDEWDCLYVPSGGKLVVKRLFPLI